MATVTPTVATFDEQDQTAKLFTWVLTSTNSDGTPMLWFQWADLCWQASGTWGGATLALEGSNNGTVWFPLSNAAGGAAATFTADGGKTVIERPVYVRPNLTTVGAGATITVTCAARRSQQLRY